jgi:hypothetical protein
MRERPRLSWRGLLPVLAAAYVFLGCMPVPYRAGTTLEQGELSQGLSYMRSDNLEHSDTEPLQFLALDGRFGAAEALDVGLTHTIDFTEDGRGRLGTVSADLRVQLTNRENTLGRPVISLGLMKGYMYDDDTDLHVTSLPVTVSFPLTKRLTPYFTYRYDLLSDHFLLERFDDTRSTFVLGSEVELIEPASGRPTPTLGLAVGTYSSVYGGDGDQGLILSVGVSIKPPPE